MGNALNLVTELQLTNHLQRILPNYRQIKGMLTDRTILGGASHTVKVLRLTHPLQRIIPNCQPIKGISFDNTGLDGHMNLATVLPWTKGKRHIISSSLRIKGMSMVGSIMQELWHEVMALELINLTFGISMHCGQLANGGLPQTED
jgi:hypothetical protein